LSGSQEHHEAIREKPMWFKRVVEVSKVEDKPKLSPARRSTRTRIPNKRYESNFAALMSNLVDSEPDTFDEDSCSR
jgi:hypothetical protein